ncbi:hypothetical protein ACTJIJ_04990 [Niabella sp. 22666]|uniref:hypothetical protein n=1 Tax=Niabella sp. 22666 TaxID=3453954 RepID=UPI003F852EBD
MNFQLNQNLGSWLASLNGKTVSKIYQVDYNEKRYEDDYLPWLFLITFANHDQFLQIEGDLDAEHIKIDLFEIGLLESRLHDYNLAEEPHLWEVYPTAKDETLGQLIDKQIERIEYGIDKDEYEISGAFMRGEKDVFTFIRFHCVNTTITIFEAMGLGVSDDPSYELSFKDSFDTFSTRQHF